MEKLYNNSRDMTVMIYCKRYNRIYIPKSIFNRIQDARSDEVGAVDVWVDESKIKLIPNASGEFAFVHNGSSPSGRYVALNRIAITKYGITEGHYQCEVDDNGVLTITLERIDEDA